MNKNTLTLKRRKKNLKEVHAAQMATPTRGVPLFTQELVERKRLNAPQEKARLKISLTKVQAKKKKPTTKTSKRTTPGELPKRSTRSVHPEGTRWIKTLKKQTKASVKTFRTKTAKRHPSGKLAGQLR